jgi:integration host factor subunit alpha
MTLTKSQIIEEVRANSRLTKKQSLETVETLLEIMKETLASGDDVLISGFGKFCIKNKRERSEWAVRYALALCPLPSVFYTL